MRATDGLTEEQSTALFQLILKQIRKSCVCHAVQQVAKEGTPRECYRCKTVGDLSRLFPETWAVCTDVYARLGDRP